MYNQKQSESQPLILEKMRQLVIANQRKLRDEIINDSRRIFDVYSNTPAIEEMETTIETVQRPFRAPVDELEEETSKSINYQNNHRMGMKEKRKRRRPPTSNIVYATRFQVPGWLIVIPNDFSDYLLALKPSGKRVLMFINGSKVISREKSGHTLHEFWSEYAGKSAMTTILDAIFNAQSQTYYIMDVIQWKGNYLTAESALFRQNWLASNLPKVQLSNGQCPFSFQIVPVYQNTRNSIIKLYNQHEEFQKQGFVFTHPESKYLHRSNQSVLCWKDSRISEFPIDTEDDGVTFSLEVKATGVIAKDYGLYTLDNHKIWQLQQADASGLQMCECRFGFTKIVIEEKEKKTMVEQGQQDKIVVKLEGFRMVSSSNYKKGHTDPLSKLIYQYRARHNPLTIEQILDSLPAK